MIELKNILFQDYLKVLIDRIFKILPLYEEKNEGLFENVDSLIYELEGLQHVIKDIKSGSDYISLLATLNSLLDDSLILDDNKPVIKREVFKCISIVQRIGEKSKSGDA